jgi:hypothetical protein
MKRMLAALTFGLSVGSVAALAGTKNPDMSPVPERNKNCFGDEVLWVLSDETTKRSLKLKVPTRFFGINTIYQADLEERDRRKLAEMNSSPESNPDYWPHCAKEPLDFGAKSISMLFDAAIGDGYVDRRGTLLEPFPPNSVYTMTIGLSPMLYDFRDGHFLADKNKLRRWFEKQDADGKLKTIIGGFRSVSNDSERVDSPALYNWLFESSKEISEPTTGLPIIYDCSSWADENFIRCGTIYELFGGLTLSYQFLYNGLPKSQWADLDKAMRKLAIGLIDDDSVRRMNEDAGK